MYISRRLDAHPAARRETASNTTGGDHGERFEGSMDALLVNEAGSRHLKHECPGER
jgi:hypothetical protein